jgi:hypothetical protein
MRAPVAIAFVVAVLGVQGALVGSAAALEPGVHVSPGSPAGKEYSFPLDVLRAQAVGHYAAQGVAQPLFGVGIGPVAPGIASGGLNGAVGQPAVTGLGAASGPVQGAGASGATTRAGTAGRSGATSESGLASQSQLSPAEIRNLTRTQSPVGEIALLTVLVLAAGLAGAAVFAALRRRQS